MSDTNDAANGDGVRPIEGRTEFLLPVRPVPHEPPPPVAASTDQSVVPVDPRREEAKDAPTQAFRSADRMAPTSTTHPQSGPVPPDQIQPDQTQPDQTQPDQTAAHRPGPQSTQEPWFQTAQSGFHPGRGLQTVGTGFGPSGSGTPDFRPTGIGPVGPPPEMRLPGPGPFTGAPATASPNSPSAQAFGWQPTFAPPTEPSRRTGVAAGVAGICAIAMMLLIFAPWYHFTTGIPQPRDETSTVSLPTTGAEGTVSGRGTVHYITGWWQAVAATESNLGSLFDAANGKWLFPVAGLLLIAAGLALWGRSYRAAVLPAAVASAATVVITARAMIGIDDPPALANSNFWVPLDTDVAWGLTLSLILSLVSFASVVAWALLAYPRSRNALPAAPAADLQQEPEPLLS